MQASRSGFSPGRFCALLPKSLINKEIIAWLQVVDADELVPVGELGEQPVLLAVAAFFGAVRLVDNIVLQRTL